MNVYFRLIKTLAFLVCIVVSTVLMVPAAASADNSERVVRVGWHEEPYFITDQYGRWSGYTYDYQQKIAAYTGWKYEYVEGSWSELMQKLRAGEIDLMGNVSYTEERAKDMLYASLPMGTEVYYLFVSPENHDIVMEDVSSINGKKVGVAKDSMQSELFRDWAKDHGVKPKIVELSSTEDESLLLLGSQIDAFVTMDIRRESDSIEPIWKIGSSDFFFALGKARSDLLVELNDAMSRIQDENKYYNQQLNDKYLSSTETNRFLTDKEKEWLADHGTVRVGYQDNYLAFCAEDKATGALTGALKDYLDYASTALENAQIDFEAVSYPTAAAAIEALKNGEVDCMFPANLTEYESEMLDVVMTPALMRTEMDAVVRAADKKEFILQDKVVVAVDEGNTNYDMFLADNFPGWEIRYYKDTPTGLDAIAAGEADCVILSNYRYNNIAKQCEKLHLTTVYTGVDLDYCLAVRRGDTVLYSILSKITAIVPDSTIHTALTYYSSEDVKTSFSDLVKDNLFIILAVIAGILIIILLLLLRSIRAERKAIEEERMINAIPFSCNSQEIINKMTEEVNAFTGEAEQSDDLTMLTIRYTKLQHLVRFQKEITLNNNIEQIPQLAEYVETVCEAMEFDAATSMQMNLAIEEAVVNVMNYAYPKGVQGDIKIMAQANDQRLKFTISDNGMPFDPTTRQAVDTTLTAEERPIGGLGIHLITQLMDSINYERKDNKNILTLRKKLPATPSSVNE